MTAVDVRSGRTLWTWRHTLPRVVRTLGFARVNRGVAALGDMVYVGTIDAHLVALDARSGAVRWDTVVADHATGHCITVAPLAIDGKIIMGISGGEAGIRGFIDAYDAKTGKRVWRFWTIPGPGEPGNDTWHAPDSWKTGGGSTWVTGSYDPELKLIYWGVGNPGPDWNGDPRPGDNLYTCSLVALDAETGKLRWHFQFTPHDVHDWDATEIPVLLDTVVRGKPRKVVAMANRNAFYYLLDRATGEFLAGTPYAKQTWAKGLDDSGRPVLLPNSAPSEEGTLVWPSLQGATNWFSPSYDAARKQFYVPVREMGAYYYKGEAEYKPGTFFAGGGERALHGDEAYGAIRALDAATGKNEVGVSPAIATVGRRARERPADWCSASRAKATFSRSIPRAASRYGIFKPARRGTWPPIRCRSRSMAVSTWRSRPGARFSSSDYETGTVGQVPDLPKNLRTLSEMAGRGPLSSEELRKIDAYWRAANYLSVGQIYLYDNPLLSEPLGSSTSSRACWAIGAPRPA